MEIKDVYIEGDIVVLQNQTFQDGGWYIEVDTKINEIRVKEIPQFGGEPCMVGVYPNLKEAILAGEKLT